MENLQLGDQCKSQLKRLSVELMLSELGHHLCPTYLVGYQRRRVRPQPLGEYITPPEGENQADGYH